MKIIQFSNSHQNSLTNVEHTQIHIFSQFFNHHDSNRNKEIIECLQKNVNNKNITKIHLLNEKIYTYQEMGLMNSNKIIQTNIGKRLKFQHIFEYIRTNFIQGYMILVNIDIFFDNTLQKLKLCDIHETKKMFALLRYEYNGDENTSQLFGPRFDSQDTWIFHSNNIIKDSEERAFNFQMGQPGCDNKIIYLLKILGYEIINDPKYIKTFHNHSSQIRNYTSKDVIKEPWGVITPYDVDQNIIPSSLGINLKEIYSKKQDIWFEDNDILREYIQSKIENKTPFIIPRISGIENNFACFSKMINKDNKKNIENYIDKVNYAMKNNAGIRLSNMTSVIKYSDFYLKAFENCDLYNGWDLQGNYINHIKDSHDFIKKKFTSKQMIWSLSLDIFHYIHSKPWTQSLHGKRILIISPFINTISKQILNLPKLYDGVDLFPDCQFIFIKPPMTQCDEDSLEFDEELDRFYINLEKLKDKFDVALVSSGGYCNLICNQIFEKYKKSAIYVGGVLQMYFGILGNRWITERPDILRLYMNEYWVRPSLDERPKGHNKCEKSCYW
jgi:hypothetical protein